MSAKQLEASMDMMRSVCAPKFKSLTTELLDGLRKGDFVENKDLKVYILFAIIMWNYVYVFITQCYTFCIAQMAGTVSTWKSILKLTPIISNVFYRLRRRKKSIWKKHLVKWTQCFPMRWEVQLRMQLYLVNKFVSKPISINRFNVVFQMLIQFN